MSIEDDVKQVREGIEQERLFFTDGDQIYRILDRLEHYEKALKWIVRVNALDREYQEVAREALAKVREEK